jgi:hypothetical protein
MNLSPTIIYEYITYIHSYHLTAGVGTWPSTFMNSTTRNSALDPFWRTGPRKLSEKPVMTGRSQFSKIPSRERKNMCGTCMHTYRSCLALWKKCYAFKKYFRRKIWRKKLAFFAQSFFEKCDQNIGFWEKRPFFRGKMAENCDHNIKQLPVM